MDVSTWVDVCAVGGIAVEDVIAFEVDERKFAIYRTAHDEYYATDGLCTHARVSLAGGFLMGTTVECPKHNGRFDIRTGEAQRLPAVRPLRTYPVRVEAGRVLICPGVRVSRPTIAAEVLRPGD
ncbi:MAG: non-heme iron oxygenase ferredoxin subunit [Pontimonas sp.]|jgi:3-phenylpropionate/trans-cinnamate dioxygenase ferredoxin subunit